jgi:hypothetical protein
MQGTPGPQGFGDSPRAQTYASQCPLCCSAEHIDCAGRQPRCLQAQCPRPVALRPRLAAGLPLSTQRARFVRSHWQMHNSLSKFHANTPITSAAWVRGRRAELMTTGLFAHRDKAARALSNRGTSGPSGPAARRSPSKDDVKSPGELRIMASRTHPSPLRRRSAMMSLMGDGQHNLPDNFERDRGR